MSDTAWYLAATVFALGILFWETRLQRRFRLWRLFSIALMVLSLLGIIMDPRIPSNQENLQIGLLTPGYTTSQIDSISELNPGIKWFRTRHVAQSEVELIDDLGSLPALSFIVGQGLPEDELENLDSVQFVFVSAPKLNGIYKLQIPTHVVAQRQNRVVGSYRNSAAVTKLRLTVDGQVVDSAVFKTAEELPFALSFMPKVSGPLKLTIAEQDETGETIRRSPLYLQVEDPRQLKISVRTSFPTAEIRFLKNFLTAQGHQLVVQSTISRDRTRTEMINRSGTVPHVMASGFLATQDVLLVDQSTLSSLTRAEKNQLSNAVQEGLGLILLLTDSSPPKTEDFLSYRIDGKPSIDTASCSLPLLRTVKLERLNAIFPQDVNALLRSEQGEVLEGYRYYGAGKVGFQTLTAVYSLLLSGLEEEYAQIWSPLLEEVARVRPIPIDFSITSPFPWIANRPVHFQMVAGPGEPEILLDGQPVPILEDTQIDNLWTGRIWLDSLEGSTLQIDSNAVPLPVYRPEDWQALQAEQRMASTAAAAGRFRSALDQPEHTVQVYQSLRALFFGLFLASAGFLWLSPKL